MKTEIDGKIYDTELANVVDGFYPIMSRHSENYIMETLYKKKTGEFFLHGEGGKKTRYAICGGEGIIPLSFDDARNWIIEHSDPATLKLFCKEPRKRRRVKSGNVGAVVQG